MFNLDTFNRTMAFFKVPVDNSIIGGDYLDRPVEGRLFTGKDEHGRVFVNIPVEVVTCKGVVRKMTFVAFQRYTTNEEIFLLSHQPVLMDRKDFFGYVTGFSKLALLMAGRSVRFYEHRFDESTRTDVPVEDNYIDVRMCPYTRTEPFVVCSEWDRVMNRLLSHGR